MQAADAPGAGIKVVFEPSTRNVGNFVKTIIGDSGTKQEFVNGLAQDYVLPRDIVVTFKDCGELNAWYDPQAGTITMCYDIIEYAVTIVSDIEMGTVGGMPASGSQQGGAPAQQTSSGQQGGAPAGPPFDELLDLGMPPTPLLFLSPYIGPTPVEIPGGQLITTEGLAGILTSDQPRLLIDTRGGAETLPDALVVTDAGRDGSLTDTFQSLLQQFLGEQTGGDAGVAIVFFGDGMNDRSAYNATLRAAKLGYQNVYWYRGGKEAWVANGLPLAAPQ
jgi:hypothetical protein